MISWITMAILSAVRRSTSGRAPWFRAIIRFWIRVDSLNRPPTLLTISSSFSSSSIGRSTSAAEAPDEVGEGADGLVQVLVDDMGLVMAIGQFDLSAGVVEAAADGRLVV